MTTETVNIMGTEAIMVEEAKADGVAYELWAALHSDEAIVRVFDTDAGELVSLKKFPHFLLASSAYFQATILAGESA